jgi:hypothetical protein
LTGCSKDTSIVTSAAALAPTTRPALRAPHPVPAGTPVQVSVALGLKSKVTIGIKLAIRDKPDDLRCAARDERQRLVVRRIG